MRFYVIATILIIVGLGEIACKGTLEQNSTPLSYIYDVSSALLVGGALSLLFGIFQERNRANNWKCYCHRSPVEFPQT